MSWFREKGFRGSDDGELVGLERVDEGVRGEIERGD